MARVRALGSDLPIIPGIMPVTRVSQIERFADLSGAALPSFVTDRLHEVAHDPALVRAAGVDLATVLSEELLAGGSARAALHHHEPLAGDPRDLRPAPPVSEPGVRIFCGLLARTPDRRSG